MFPKPCLFFPSCFNLVGISLFHKLWYVCCTWQVWPIYLWKEKNPQWWIIHIFLSKLLECFTSHCQVFPQCVTYIFLAVVETRYLSFSHSEKEFILPFHCLCSSFYILKKKSSSFSLVCVQMYSPVAFLRTGVSEPPGTLAWPTKISCAKPWKVLCHFSELNWLTKKATEQDGPFWGEAFHVFNSAIF